MPDLLVRLYEWNPGLVMAIVVGAVLIPMALLFKTIFKDPPKYPQARFPGDQASIVEAFSTVALKNAEDWGKGIGKQMFLRKNLSSGIIAPAVILMALFVVVVGALSYILPDTVKVSLVRKGEVCTGYRNEVLTYLPEGTEKKSGDICNGAEVVITQAPTQMPTQTLLPTSVFTPEEKVVLPSVTPEPAEQSGKVIKVVLLDGSPAEQGWIEVPSLDGYHQVDDAKCGDVLEIPTSTSFAFVLFEGGRGNWLISDSIANVSDTKVGIAGSNLTIEYCKVGSWFSLWIK